MKLRKISFLPLLAALLILFNSSLSFVRAQEFVISGNGAGSDNQINVQATTATTVTQTNDAQVTNNVSADANSGGNTASLNTGGDATITTGDINSQTTVQNDLNNSSTSLPCCETQPTDITISGNGAGSENSVGLNQTNTLNINIDNNADVFNGVSISANSGGNSANYNGGSVLIDTGNINIKEKIKNGPINVYNVSAGISGGGVSAVVSDNASLSTNNISAVVVNTKNASLNSVAKLANIVFVDANTGNNHADGNMGDVSIITGDILIDSTIENGPINVGGVDFSCCDVNLSPSPSPSPTPSPTPTPYDPGNPSSSGSSSGGGSGDGGSGGPSVLGLSNTSSQTEQAIVLLAGLAMIIGGALLISKEYGKKEYFAFN